MVSVRSGEELRELVEKVAPVTLAAQRVLPVSGVLESLFASRGLVRGTVVEVGGATGSTSVALALMAAASRSGSWVGCVGFPQLGWEAAEEHGVELDRLVAVDVPSARWPTAVATLVDAFDLVVCGPEVVPTPAQLRRVRARAREKGAVVVAVSGPVLRSSRHDALPERRGWSSPDLRIRVHGSSWEGLGVGWGILDTRRLEVAVDGRGPYSRARSVELCFDGSGRLREVRGRAGGLEAAGLEAAGMEAAGMEAAGMEAAGMEAAG